MKRRNQDPLVWMLRVVVSLGSLFFGFTLILVHILDGCKGESSMSPHEPLPRIREWPYPLIHIVNTRFQQDQANLTSLGRARLLLFETFCLNTIVGQTVLQEPSWTPFLWIIKVDPNLDENLLRDLISLVVRYDFIYVVASNVNFGIGRTEGGWRGGEAGRDILASRLYTGNRTLLEQAHLARETRAVLETRIDVDDGLHREFIEHLQAQALRTLRYTSDQTRAHTQDWMYVCTLRSIDWNPTLRKEDVSVLNSHGIFIARKSPHVCITPGITSGVSIGVKESQVPRYGHYDLVQKLRGTSKGGIDCGPVPPSKCLQFLSDPFFGAIRSRTPTSAGMRAVVLAEDQFKKALNSSDSYNFTQLSKQLWLDFNCRLESIVRVNQHLREHLIDIVGDNLRGQCTRGHSCKNSSKQTLLNLLAMNDTRQSV